MHCYRDSMIVLGYLTNQKRRFSKYVTRRVGIVLTHTKAEEWSHVGANNPADLASRPTTSDELMKSFWYNGPEFLWQRDYSPVRYELQCLTTTDFSDEKETETNHPVRSVHCRRTLVFMENRVLELLHRTIKYEVLAGDIKHIITFTRELITKVRCRKELCAPAANKKAALYYVIYHVQSE